MPKGASLRPSDMSASPDSVNTESKRELHRISTQSLQELTANAMLPTYDTVADLDIRGAPTVWVYCINRVSRRHLALHAFCLASADKRMLELSELRKQALEICDSTGDERGLFWLMNRPSFFVNCAVMEQRRTRINCWNAGIKMKLTGMAESYGTTARSIIIAYSSKSLLASDTDLGGWRTVLSRIIVQEWDKVLDNEIANIKRLFGIGVY